MEARIDMKPQKPGFGMSICFVVSFSFGWF